MGKLQKIEDNLYTLSNSIITSIKVDNDVIVPTVTIKNIFKRLYPEYTYRIYCADGQEIDISEEFSKQWELFIEINRHNIKRIFEAYSENYAPLHNYDKDSTITTTYSGSINDTNTKSGNVSTDKGQATDTNTLEVAPDSVETFYNSEKNTNVSGARHDTTTYNNVVDSNVKTYDEYRETVRETTGGNIGVTRNSELLSDEISIRKMTYAELFVSRFVALYCLPPIKGGLYAD